MFQKPLGREPSELENILYYIRYAGCLCLFLPRSALLPFLCPLLEETTFPRLLCLRACRSARPVGGNDGRLEGRLRSRVRVFLSSLPPVTLLAPTVPSLIPAPSRHPLTLWFQFPLHSPSFWALGSGFLWPLGSGRFLLWLVSGFAHHLLLGSLTLVSPVYTVSCMKFVLFEIFTLASVFPDSD